MKTNVERMKARIMMDEIIKYVWQEDERADDGGGNFHFRGLAS